jgi:hypothetical protein
MDGRHVRLGFAARLLPAREKKAGEMTEFSGALSNATIQPLPGSPRN